jgi:4-amino-4-deoxy-L-arabinose transferase-like glycosyltransferase
MRGRPADPRWARPALLALLVLTAALCTTGLSRNGWANDFYAAAVQAGTTSWKAFFFGSFDASNFITVDKTPGSLWVMELAARSFGLNSWSLLLPQAAEGVASVALLYATVRRWHGPAAGLIAAGVAALTPVAVLMFRYDNPDALLVLLMTAAAYATTRAIESGRTRWLVLTGCLLGFAFLTKMLQGFLVVPAFALAYLVAGPPRPGRRLWQLLAGAAALVAGAGWWVAIVELTPAAARPYIGGSTTNSVLQLALGYNGLGRLDGNETGSVGFGGGAGPQFTGSAGLTRLFAADMGGQVSWLLPAALIALAATAWLSRRAARTDRVRAAAVLWGGWLLVTGGVFSFMAGIIHPYYTVALVPPIAALTGIGAVLLWRQREHLWARLTLAGAIVVTAAWGYALLDRTPGWLPWLRALVVVSGVLAAAVVLAAPAPARRAGLVLLPGRARHRALAALTRMLRDGAAGHRWAAATVGSESAAPLQLASGEPVMAIGGFNGSDAAPTLAEFQRLVADGEIHYFVGANRASFGGGSGAAAQITAWVQAHFTAETVGGVTVYDLTQAR